MGSFDCVYTSYDLVEPIDGNDPYLSPVILLHGMTSTRKTWEDLPRILADRTKRKVFALDARNHGESGWNDKFNFDVLTEDVFHFMSEHDIQSAVLIGHSMGGKTAMNLALKKPEKVEMLVVEDMTPKRLCEDFKYYLLQYFKEMKKCLKLIPPNTELSEAKKIAMDLLNSETPQEDIFKFNREDYGSYLPLTTTPDGKFAWQVNLTPLENTLDHPKIVGELQGVYEGPTLVIYGTRSFLEAFKDKDLFLNLFPQAKLHPIEGATHLVHAERPKEFSKVVLDFILQTDV